MVSRDLHEFTCRVNHLLSSKIGCAVFSVASAGLGESRNSVLDDRISFVTVAINSFLMLVLKNHDQTFF